MHAYPQNCLMPKKHLSFKELVEAAAKAVPEVWDDDDVINLSALSRYYKKKGHPVSQATLSRLFNGKHKAPRADVVEATHVVLRIPRSMLRGDPMAADVEEILGRYSLSTLLLAKRLEDLPSSSRRRILEMIEEAYEKEEQIRRLALAAPNVTPIKR
jgi:hypothetical protein